MIVVDLGCATYHGFPEDESTHVLLERFEPSVYYGFDPHPSVVERDLWVGKTRTIVERKAAWVYDGTVGFVTVPDVLNELRSHVDAGEAVETVPCFELADFLTGLPAGDVVLKLDVEGAEYTLLPYLREKRADELLTLIIVEWHGPPAALAFACPVEEWS